MFQALILVFTLAALPSELHAWERIGHRVVGEIAQNHLTPKARAGVAELLGVEELPQAAGWADNMRSHPNKKYYGKFTPWHYATVPYGKVYTDDLAPKEGDIVQAMKKMDAVLRSGKADKKAKREALRLLTHFIGDVHQPLHVGNEFDMGANWCHVKWFGKPTKLHKVWDMFMIDHLKLSYTEYADLLDHASKKQIKKWQSTSYVDWANESVEIRPGIYPGAKPKDGKLPERTYCVKGWGNRPDEELMPKLSWNYEFKMRKIFDKRLLQAGIRLAGVLNSVFK